MTAQLLWQGDTPLDYQSHSSPAVWRDGTVRCDCEHGKVEKHRLIAFPMEKDFGSWMPVRDNRRRSSRAIFC